MYAGTDWLNSYVSQRAARRSIADQRLSFLQSLRIVSTSGLTEMNDVSLCSVCAPTDLKRDFFFKISGVPHNAHTPLISPRMIFRLQNPNPSALAKDLENVIASSQFGLEGVGGEEEEEDCYFKPFALLTLAVWEILIGCEIF